jgi:Mg2+ and Co2+ transporter CorA
LINSILKPPSKGFCISFFTNFSEKLFEEKVLNDISESKAFKINKKSTTWINVDGAHDAVSIQSIGAFFKLDPLVVEDTLNTAISPKFENLVYVN